MKKNAIIDLIKSDLDEIKQLVETFREPDRIANDFIDLLRQKHESIGKEIMLLRYWATEGLPSSKDSELVASVAARKTESAPLPTQEKAKEETAKEVRTEAKPERELVPDYFSDELDEMPDPFAGIAIAPANEPLPHPTSELPKEENTETIKIELSQPPKSKEVKIEGIGEREETKSQEPNPQKEEPKEQPKVQIEQQQKKEQPKEQPKESPKASAADIATYGTPVNDVTRAIGINDRFLYQRELFKGNKMAYDAAIETINAAASYQMAYQYLKQTFNWDETDPTVEAFYKAVHRRFL